MIEQINQNKAEAKSQLDQFRSLSTHFHTIHQTFSLKCNTSLEQLSQLLNQSYQQTSTTITAIDKFVIDGNNEIKHLQQKTKLNHNQIENEKHWIKHTNQILKLQNQNLSAEQSYHNHLHKSVQQIDNLVDIFINTIEQKQLRKTKVNQFIQSLKTTYLSVKNPQPVQKRVHTQPYKNLPQIEFNPEAKQLIFRVQTFEAKIVEFILFFDPFQKKFGLKNPCKVFQSMDLNAVRAFNYHKDMSQFHSELCLLVVKYIDNGDDLPKYEGP